MRDKKINGLMIRKQVKLADKALRRDDPAFLSACVLLASGYVGTSESRISKLLGEPISDVKRIAVRLRRNGIWKRGKIVHSGWFDKETGGISFWCDVAVGTGMLRRT